MWEFNGLFIYFTSELGSVSVRFIKGIHLKEQLKIVPWKNSLIDVSLTSDLG